MNDDFALQMLSAGLAINVHGLAVKTSKVTSAKAEYIIQAETIA